MKLSVVVCTYNTSNLLEICLTSLINQKDHANQFNIIVIDNNSTDNTKEVIDEFIRKSKCIQIKYIFEQNQGLSYARNTGYKNSIAEYIAYFDDDSRADDLLISRILLRLDESNPDVVGGPCFPYYTTEQPKWFKNDYEIRSNGSLFKAVSEKESLWGSNMIFKRELLEKLGGFDVSLGMKGKKIFYGEETDLLDTMKNKKYKIYYDPELYIEHHVPVFKMKIGYFVKKYFLFGKASLLISKKQKKQFKRHLYECYLIMKIPFIFIIAFFLRNKIKYPYFNNYFVEKIAPLFCFVGEELFFIKYFLEKYSRAIFQRLKK